MKQHEAVILTLEKLGGIATLGQLYQEVMNIPDCKWGTKTPFASIRRIVQLQTKDIYKIKPGLYGLIKYKSKNESNGFVIENEQNQDSELVKEFNHSYYQGLILNIGNLKKFETFCPNQDKNKKFLNQKLDDIRTLKNIPKFSYDNFVQRSSTIDVIWFNERDMPFAFFEVEHSTDIQNSLLKFNDLRDFYSRMVIVANTARKLEYQKKIEYSSFKEIKKRVEFLDYISLTKQYERAFEEQSYSTLII